MPHLITTLNEIDRGDILDHLLRLSSGDRYTRFFVPVTDDIITKYVNKNIDFKKSELFGIYDNKELVAFVHLSIIDGTSAELGISIDANHRGRGLADKLMERVKIYCAAYGIKVLFMTCLSQNKKMKHLAVKHGMKVVTDPDESMATLETTDPVSPLSVSSNMFMDQISMMDRIYRMNSETVMQFLKMGFI